MVLLHTSDKSINNIEINTNKVNIISNLEIFTYLELGFYIYDDYDATKNNHNMNLPLLVSSFCAINTIQAIKNGAKVMV